jgi:hypothetical protein
VADPWTEDLAALGDRSRHQLRSIAATRSSVLPNLVPQESKMRLFKNHPILATLITLAVLAIAAPVAYAVVDRVFISVDPDKSASEIEQDIRSQLEHANVQADVTAEKTDGRVEVRIVSGDERMPNLDVDVPDGSLGQLRLQVTCELTPAQALQLQQAATSPAVIALLGGPADPQFATKLKQALADRGFHDVDVTIAGSSISVTVKAPPR